MQKHQILRSALLLLLTAGLSVPSSTGQQLSSSPGAQAKMVVTVEARHGGGTPVINREDVMVYEGHDRDKVTN
jgi:hypothetical protein